MALVGRELYTEPMASGLHACMRERRQRDGAEDRGQGRDQIQSASTGVSKNAQFRSYVVVVCVNFSRSHTVASIRRIHLEYLPNRGDKVSCASLMPL